MTINKALRVARIALIVSLIVWALPIAVVLLGGSAPMLLYATGIYAVLGIAISAVACVPLTIISIVRSRAVT